MISATGNFYTKLRYGVASAPPRLSRLAGGHPISRTFLPEADSAVAVNRRIVSISLPGHYSHTV